MESFIVDVGTDREIWDYVLKLIEEHGISVSPGVKNDQSTTTSMSIRYIPGDNRIISASTEYYLRELYNIRRVPVIELRKHLKELKKIKRLVIKNLGFEIEPGKYIHVNCTTLRPNEIKTIMEIYAPDAGRQCPSEDAHLSSTTRC